MKASCKLSDRFFQGIMYSLLGFSLVALAITFCLELRSSKPDPRLHPMPSETVWKALQALKSGDLDAFAGSFAPEVGDALRKAPDKFWDVQKGFSRTECQVLGEGMEGSMARVRVRFRLMIDGQPKVEEATQVLRWEGGRWLVVR